LLVQENIAVTDAFEYIAGFMAERLEKPKGGQPAGQPAAVM